MKTLTPTKIEKIWDELERLKESAEKNEEQARKNGSEDLSCYYNGLKRGLQYALNWIDYHLKN